MTIDEAIEILKDGELNPCVTEDREACDMAIKALEQEPCEDAISRQAVIEYIKASDAELGHSSEKEIVVEDILNMSPVTLTKCIATVKFSKKDMQELINEKMKDIVMERKKGKWINGNPICPCCGEDKFKDLDADIWADWQPKYCPNCGSFMRGEED